MELQDQILQLTAEKIAIDQCYLNSIREVLNLRKELILKDKSINDLNEQIQKLLKEKEEQAKHQSMGGDSLIGE